VSAPFQMSVGDCQHCDRPELLVGPLYMERGGPMVCIPCGTKWHAEYSRRRKTGRIVVKAIKAFLAAGGDFTAIDRLALVATGITLVAGEADTIGAEVGDITAELLEDAIRLTHPDRHPPERQESATRVTQELIALKPFVFPAPKPEAPKAPEPKRDGFKSGAQCTDTKPLRQDYPCELCVDQSPYNYCSACKAEWDKRQNAKDERERAKRRAWYARRRQWQLYRRPPAHCAACGDEFKAGRKDAKYCAAACRQRKHRERVTAQNHCSAALTSNRNAPSTESMP
jgi:uncharacterized Zn ribbon protein